MRYHSRVSVATLAVLGGALAALCALDVQYNFPEKDVSCYTYGSPKVGNSDFRQSYDKRVPKTYRFVNSADTVPSLPPGRYEHVGVLHQLGQAVSDASSLVDKMVDKVEDHFPHNYIKALQEFFHLDKLFDHKFCGDLGCLSGDLDFFIEQGIFCQ